ncbi:MAG: AMP-binding protein, partial [Acidimicrobiales bacterium]
MALVVEKRSSSDAPAPTVTVASLARDWGISDPNRIAMREKDFGIWQEYSWARTWGLVMDAAHGLLALGIDVGDRVSIQAEDRPEWVILDLAAVAVRGITVGFYPTNPAAEVKYLLTDCGATVHLAEDQEQVDRVLEIDPAAVPNLGRIIYCEPRGV